MWTWTGTGASIGGACVKFCFPSRCPPPPPLSSADRDVGGSPSPPSGQDARAGIAEAHIALATHLGRAWVQGNVATILSHWGNLCAHPKCIASVTDELF